MARRAQRHWAPWVWSAAGVAVAVRLLFLLLPAGEVPEAPAPPGHRPRVTVVTESGRVGGPLVKEQMELFDQQPLSMPTEWNAGTQALPADLRRQPGQVFGMFEPRLAFAAERLDPVFGPRGTAPADGLAGLRTLGAMAGGWPGLGRADLPISRLPERAAFLAVRRFAGGESQLELGVSLTELPPSILEHDWGPVEYTVAVVSSGLLGVPTLTVASGVEEVDAFFSLYLTRDFRLGERLVPGLYRVEIVR